MIDILIPVLGRPANAGPLVNNIHEVTETDHTILTVWVLEYIADHAVGDVLGVYRDPQSAKDSMLPAEEWTWVEKEERWRNKDGALEIRKFRLQ